MYGNIQIANDYKWRHCVSHNCLLNMMPTLRWLNMRTVEISCSAYWQLLWFSNPRWTWNIFRTCVDSRSKVDVTTRINWHKSQCLVCLVFLQGEATRQVVQSTLNLTGWNGATFFLEPLSSFLAPCLSRILWNTEMTYLCGKLPWCLRWLISTESIFYSVIAS